jgi:hypothetical protein
MENLTAVQTAAYFHPKGSGEFYDLLDRLPEYPGKPWNVLYSGHVIAMTDEFPSERFSITKA